VDAGEGDVITIVQKNVRRNPFRLCWPEIENMYIRRYSPSDHFENGHRYNLTTSTYESARVRIYLYNVASRRFCEQKYYERPRCPKLFGTVTTILYFYIKRRPCNYNNNRENNYGVASFYDNSPYRYSRFR